MADGIELEPVIGAGMHLKLNHTRMNSPILCTISYSACVEGQIAVHYDETSKRKPVIND